MNEQNLCMCPVSLDQARPPARATERPIKICVVFDDDASAESAEILIRHVVSDSEFDQQSYNFDELDMPIPGVVAARSACNSDIIVFAVQGDRTLPSHVKVWLSLCIRLRGEDQDGALVLLVAERTRTSNAGLSLLAYLKNVAVIGRMAFFPRQRGIDERYYPTRKHFKMEDMLCGSSD